MVRADFSSAADGHNNRRNRQTEPRDRVCSTRRHSSIFALCPINTQTFHSYPGVNGFGIYNRHTSLLLYVLTSALVFLPTGRKLAVVAALTMLALFLTKITGFLAGGLIGLFAIFAGRFRWRHVLLAACIFALALLLLEFNHGMISAYLKSIAVLVGKNEGLLLSRFLTVFSIKLDVILAAASLDPLFALAGSILRFRKDPDSTQRARASHRFSIVTGFGLASCWSPAFFSKPRTRAARSSSSSGPSC